MILMGIEHSRTLFRLLGITRNSIHTTVFWFNRLGTLDAFVRASRHGKLDSCESRDHTGDHSVGPKEQVKGLSARYI